MGGVEEAKGAVIPLTPSEEEDNPPPLREGVTGKVGFPWGMSRRRFEETGGIHPPVSLSPQGPSCVLGQTLLVPDLCGGFCLHSRGAP